MKIGPSLVGAAVGGVVGATAQIILENSMGMEATWFALVTGVLTGLGARSMAGESIGTTSYLRAGLAGVIGLAAIVGGSYASSELVRNRNVSAYEAQPMPPAIGIEIATTAEGQGESTTEESTGEDESTAVSTEETGEGDAKVNLDSENGDSQAESTQESADAARSDEEDTASEEGEEIDGTANTQPPQQLTLTTADNVGQLRSELPPPSPWQFAFAAIGTFLAYELARGGGKGKAPIASTDA